jgi:hypothetical protein
MAQAAGVMTDATGSSSHSTANLKSALLELPTEIRLNIFQEIFKAAKVEIKVRGKQLHFMDEKITSILRVDRLLRAEALPIAHATVSFHGTIYAFTVLAKVTEGYGGFLDVSTLAKVRISWEAWHESIVIDPVPWPAGWIGRSSTLQDVCFELGGTLDPRPGINISSTNELYESAALRQSELGFFTSGGSDGCVFGDVGRLCAKMCDSTLNRPSVVIEGKLYMSAPDVWVSRFPHLSRT